MRAPITTMADCGDEKLPLPNVRREAGGALLEAAKGVQAGGNEAARKIRLELVEQTDE